MIQIFLWGVPFCAISGAVTVFLVYRRLIFSTTEPQPISAAASGIMDRMDSPPSFLVSGRSCLSYSDTWSVYLNSRLAVNEVHRLSQCCGSELADEVAEHVWIVEAKHAELKQLFKMAMIEAMVSRLIPRRLPHYGIELLWTYAQEIATVDNLASLCNDARASTLATRFS